MRQIWASEAGAFGSSAWLLRIRHAAVALAFVTMSSACSAPIAATSDSVEFVCTVSGAEMLKPAPTDASICATFKQHIDDALPRATKNVQSASGTHWIKVDVSFSKPATVKAVLTRKDGAVSRVHPEIAVDVMDKALGANELTMLAKEVAKLVSGKE